MGPVLHDLVLCSRAGSMKVLLGHFTFPKYRCTDCTLVRCSPGAVYPVCLVRMCGKQNCALFTVERELCIALLLCTQCALCACAGNKKLVLFTVEPGAVYSQWAFVPSFVLLIYRSFITAEG